MMSHVSALTLSARGPTLDPDVYGRLMSMDVSI